jgi:predicted O-methyltransferase YrrM
MIPWQGDKAVFFTLHGMSENQLIDALLTSKPYFGPVMCALQGIPKRHAYMQALIELLSTENPGGPVKVLEVGSWAGGSAITWARAIQRYFGGGQVICVDHWQPYFDTTINTEPVYVKMNEAATTGLIYGLFLHNIRTSGVGHLISPIVGSSGEVLRALNKGDFAIVYLDGCHDLRIVQDDIKLSMDLVKEGGILCGDDLELQLSEVGAAEVATAVASAKDYVRSAMCDVFYHPGVTAAVAAAFGEASAWEGFWAMRKTAEGWIKVDLAGCAVVIPEHMSTGKFDATNAADDKEQLTTMIAQIADRISKDGVEPDSPGNCPQLIGAYRGFNIVRLNGYYYGVRQSLGEIDWSISGTELAKRYGESDFIRSRDATALIDGISLKDLLKYVEKLSSAIAESLLRQETVMDLLGRRIASLEQHMQRGAEHCQISEYHDYRLVRLRQDYCVAIRNDVEGWDETLSAEEMSVRYADAVIIRHSVDALCAQIDFNRVTQDSAREIAGLRAQLAEAIAGREKLHWPPWLFIGPYIRLVSKRWGRLGCHLSFTLLAASCLGFFLTILL